MNIITLTTDFGQRDWFVGVMKGVMLARHSGVRIVDLTHEVPGGDIRAGAFALLTSYRWFPRRTVHVAVVDPGVGSERGAIAVRTADYDFVGPDNGLLSWALAGQRIRSIRHLSNTRLWLEPVSATFHGRDIFAPVAAYLSGGGAFARLGHAANDYLRLEWPEPRRTPDGWLAQVVHVDRFGNAITNLQGERLELGAEPVKATAKVLLPGGKRCPVKGFYGAVATGKPVGVVGSTGFLEIAVHGGHAGRELGLRVGTRVRVAPAR